MKWLCKLFLALVVMNLVVSAQTKVESEQKEPSQASRFDEFGNIPNGHIKALIDGFFIELMNNSVARGYIINYGSDRDVSRREQFLKDYLMMRNFDASKITFVKGGVMKEIRTELWVVPQNAKPPKPIPTAKIFAEIGIATNQKIKKLMEEFSNSLQNEPTATGYIINYGKASDIRKRENQIRKSWNWRCGYDGCRIVIVNGGQSKQLKTVFWLVSQGAEPPVP